MGIKKIADAFNRCRLNHDLYKQLARDLDDAKDYSLNREVTSWEAKFIESMLFCRAYTEKQRAKLAELHEELLT